LTTRFSTTTVPFSKCVTFDVRRDSSSESESSGPWNAVIPVESFDGALSWGATDLEKENFKLVVGGGVDEGEEVGVEF
jgi:hypothetical protein